MPAGAISGSTRSARILGKILLIERFAVLDETAPYTVKRSTRENNETGPHPWEHAQIRLNPEYKAWDARPEDLGVVAEWMGVIE
jgi:hypothetical protein